MGKKRRSKKKTDVSAGISAGSSSGRNAPNGALSGRIEKTNVVAPPVRRRPMSKLQEEMQKKLESAKFRQLNEKMYITTGAESLKMMEDNPELFQIYHRGYEEQVKKWPRNPLDDIIGFLKKQPVTTKVADFGCGAARLSAEVPQKEVHSFDLVAANERVIACDIRNTPLADNCIDVAVFCLSLMGTDYASFLKEARRVLVESGRLIVAEVLSRFSDKNAFVKAVKHTGFKMEKERFLSDFFVIWFFRRMPVDKRKLSRIPTSENHKFPALKGSVYKKR